MLLRRQRPAAVDCTVPEGASMEAHITLHDEQLVAAPTTHVQSQQASSHLTSYLRQVWVRLCGTSPFAAGPPVANPPCTYSPVCADVTGVVEAKQRRNRRWTRFTVVISRASLVALVGALLLDFYLLKRAYLGTRTEPRSTGPARRRPHPDEDLRGESDMEAPLTHLKRLPPDNEQGALAQSQKADWDRARRMDTHTRSSRSSSSQSAMEGKLAPRPHYSKSRAWKHSNRLPGDERNAESDLYEEQLFASAAMGSQEEWSSIPSQRRSDIAPNTRRLDPYDGQRVAVVVPYVGADLPVWWDAFAEQARLNDGLVEWIIFCDKKLVRRDSPSNIRFFPVDTRRMAWLLAGVVEPPAGERPARARADNTQELTRADQGARPNTPWYRISDTSAGAHEEDAIANDEHPWMTKDDLASSLSKRKRAAVFLYQLLVVSPYYLVEFKPAFGWLFREYLGEYSHWAYGDLDVLFGDMRSGWLEPNELSDFDIVTFSFGDQYRAYLRGQLTIHKNNFHVNRVWTGCAHLVNYAERLEKFRVHRAMPLESAEGCYSLAAASDPTLRIKFTVKALSDVDEETGIEGSSSRPGQEVIIDGNGLVTMCPNLGYYDNMNERHYNAPPVSTLNNEDQRLKQDKVGPMTAVRKADTSASRCEPWIRPEHQTCVENVGPSHNLFVMRGQYFKQEFINAAAATKGRDCRAGAFYHFQAHKINYRSWNSRPPVSGAHFGIAAGPGGIVPLPVAGWREATSGAGLPPRPGQTLRNRYYCLAWTARRRRRAPKKGELEQLCAVKVSFHEAMVLVDTRPTSTSTRQTSDSSVSQAITLGGAGTPNDLASFLSSAGQWRGPKVFAMALDAADLDAVKEMPILRRVKYVRGGVLIVALLRPPPKAGMPSSTLVFPRKALMNLVSDVCETRFLLTLPGNAQLSPNAFQAVAAHLHSVSSADQARASDERNAAGPVTLIVPVRDAVTIRRQASASKLEGGIMFARPAGLASAKEREYAALALERAQASLEASKRAEKAAVTAAAAAAMTVERVTATLAALGRAPRRQGGVLSSEKPGHEWKTKEEEMMSLQISFGVGPVSDKGGKHDDSDVGRSPSSGGPPASGLGGSGDQKATIRWADAVSGPGHDTPDTRAGPHVDASPTVKTARRLQSFHDARSSRSDVWFEAAGWEVDTPVLTTWLLDALHPKMYTPALVVDMWSPGALFVRQVEEFGDSGCMDAAYALGLWRAGSSFQMVDTAWITYPSEPGPPPKDGVTYSPIAGSDGSNVLHVPGGACLRNSAIAETASIYSAFLKQVGNIYRHPRSGIAGRRRARAYKDRWDHATESTATIFANPSPTIATKSRAQTRADGPKGGQRQGSHGRLAEGAVNAGGRGRSTPVQEGGWGGAYEDRD